MPKKLPWRGTPDQLETLEELGPEIIEMHLRASTARPGGTVALGGHVDFTRAHVDEWLANKHAERKEAQDKQQADMVKAAKSSADAAIAAAIAAAISAVGTVFQVWKAW